MKFADSNVLLYAVSGDAVKASIARSLLAGHLIVSVQVLNETTWVMRRKFKQEWQQIAATIDRMAKHLTVRSIDHVTHATGLRLVQAYKLSWWDALIVAAALEAGSDTLYSEDMHAGLVVDGRLTIVNPFA